MASATSSRESKPSGFWPMNAWIFSTPSVLDARSDVDQHQRGGVDVVLADGDQAGAAAHRGADQHRPTVAQLRDDADEVLDHDVLAVGAVGRPVRVAVAAGVEGDGVVAGGAERLAGALPGVAGLATAVLQQHQRTVGVAPRSRRRGVTPPTPFQ